MKNRWPGLVTQSEDIASEVKVEGLFDEGIQKLSFKRKVKEACTAANKIAIEHELSKYKKCSAMRNECMKGNSYFSNESIQNSRAIFRFRAELFEAKLNFKNKQIYKQEQYLCDSCESAVDENSHVLFCPSYRELRDGKNLQCDRDLATYLQKVLSIRTKLRLSR